MALADLVMGWTRDGKQVPFASMRNSYESFNRLYTISREGRFPAELPLPVAAEGSYSPEGRQIAYVPLDHAFETGSATAAASSSVRQPTETGEGVRSSLASTRCRPRSAPGRPDACHQGMAEDRSSIGDGRCVLAAPPCRAA